MPKCAADVTKPEKTPACVQSWPELITQIQTNFSPLTNKTMAAGQPTTP